MRPAGAVVSGLLVALLGACYCPEVGDLRRFAAFDLATPDRALEYFQEALLRRSERHQFLVLSQELKDRVHRERGRRLTLHNYVLVRERVREVVRERAGPIADIRIGAPEYLSPVRAAVEISTSAASATVIMVLEVTYDVRFRDGTELSGHLAPTGAQVSFMDGDMVLRLALGERAGGLDPAGVHRISWFREWKIAAVEGSALVEEVGERLEAQEEPPPEGPQ